MHVSVNVNVLFTKFFLKHFYFTFSLHDQGEHSETQHRYSPDEDINEYYEDDYIDEVRNRARTSEFSFSTSSCL